MIPSPPPPVTNKPQGGASMLPASAASVPQTPTPAKRRHAFYPATFDWYYEVRCNCPECHERRRHGYHR